MKFGHIISEAGFSSFSALSEITVKLLDRKDRELTEKDFNFNKNLFSKNSDSKEKFRQLLEQGEKKPNLPNEISGRLNDDALVIYFPGQPPYFFPLF